MVLVLNKIDRLIVDKWMDAPEIYTHLNQIIENANSWIAELIMGELFQKEQLIKQRNQSQDSEWSEKIKL